MCLNVNNFVVGSAVVLQERVNQSVAAFLTTLTVDDLRKYNPTGSKRCKNDKDFEIALNKLKVYLASVVGVPQVERTYRFARGKDFGRLYCPKGLQLVWSAFRGALCNGLMTDIDMKNAHPTILLWLCETMNIACPKLFEYVMHKDYHLEELGKCLGTSSSRDRCKKLFLMATNTNQELTGIHYPFFNEYQAEMGGIQAALMEVEALAARFKSHAEMSARKKVAHSAATDGNEEGSFMNLALCYWENLFVQEAMTCLAEMEIETAVLSFDGLLAYGNYYGCRGLLTVLRNRMFRKYNIDLHWDFKPHDTRLLDELPDAFDITSVLDKEWLELMKNIDDDYLRDPTDLRRILSGCRGQGRRDAKLITWEHAARKLWTRGGKGENSFLAAWEAADSPNHDGDTLRHYSRVSKVSKHRYICKTALDLQGRTSFKEHELRDYFLKAIGDDVLYFETHRHFHIWHHGRWQETDGAIMADVLMSLVHELFQNTLSFYEKKLSQLVANEQGDSDEAKEFRKQLGAIAKTANQYGNSKNQHVLALIKNHLRSNARTNDPFDSQPYTFAFINIAFDLERKRGNNGWFHPGKYDFILMSCQKPWRQPTHEERVKVRSWFEAIFPDEALRKAYISILKSGMTSERFEYFFVATGGGRNGKGLLNEHFMYLLDMNGYAVVGHLDLLTQPLKSGANSEARSLHKKRFVRFSEPNPESGEAIRLSNVNELTGNEQLKARTGHDFSAKGDDTRLNGTSLIECNKPPPCKGDKGACTQDRWRWIPFLTKFTDDPAELASDPIRFRPKDPTLKSTAAKMQHYCALFEYLSTAEGVWNPGESLDDYMPESAKQLAKTYLAENDALSAWFMDRHELQEEVDERGRVVNFVTLKEVVTLYRESDIYKCMKGADKGRFTTQTIKAELESNLVLHKYFTPAKKVKLAQTGEYNNKEGLVHFRRKSDDDDDDDGAAGAPSSSNKRKFGDSAAGASPSQRPCLNTRAGDYE